MIEILSRGWESKGEMLLCYVMLLFHVTCTFWHLVLFIKYEQA